MDLPGPSSSTETNTIVSDKVDSSNGRSGGVVEVVGMWCVEFHVKTILLRD